MPVYKYSCTGCGMRWEKSASISSRSKPCPGCSMVMEPLIPETFSGIFNKTVTGPTPQNTGIHDLDTHIDRVIGQSSQQGWEVVEARNKDKREILAKTPGVSRRDLIKNEDGSYRAVTPEEKPVQETIRSVNSSAMSHLKRREPNFLRGDNHGK